ncbi:co-chaperone HscB [Morganella morganii]|nr:co-chaperone HscB [Morganella morganii]
MNYFSLFSLPVRYDLDTQVLAGRYQDLQRQYHPDRFAAGDAKEQAQALTMAATINEAYQSLKHPLKRAEYMLLLHDIDINNEQHTMHDTVFLMEQMELREALDIIEQKQDSDALAGFAANITKMTKTRMAEMVSQLYDEDWSAAADSVRKLRFLSKLTQQIENIEERLFDSF